MKYDFYPFEIKKPRRRRGVLVDLGEEITYCLPIIVYFSHLSTPSFYKVNQSPYLQITISYDLITQ